MVQGGVILAGNDEMGDLSLAIAQRRHGLAGPQGLTGFTAAFHFAGPGAALPEGFADAAEFVAGVVALHERQALVDYFLRRIAGDLVELRVTVFDYAIQIRDEHRAAALLDRLR